MYMLLVMTSLALAWQNMRTSESYFKEEISHLREKLSAASSRAISPTHSHNSEDSSTNLEDRLELEKSHMLNNLHETKTSLLEEFTTLRSRLRSRIAVLEKNGESKQRRIEELHEVNVEMEKKLLGHKEEHKRLQQQYKNRCETTHAQLVRAKMQEQQFQSELQLRNQECDDLKQLLHDQLSGGKLSSMPSSTPSRRHTAPRGYSSGTTPFR
eukprot:TRINITY_DN6398_c0_g1_i3.p1 TRINITY_DN6398_c0_g1~~TRINITY_DN6398_c0_g1_i3.p1  ORF type:complete len:212 (+),score=26.70 TRINITY_DN6398_c0_g1_i3:89-724(+)